MCREYSCPIWSGTGYRNGARTWISGKEKSIGNARCGAGAMALWEKCASGTGNFIRTIGPMPWLRETRVAADFHNPISKAGSAGGHGGDAVWVPQRRRGTSYLSSSVKFIYIADSVFLRRLLVFSIGKPVGNRYQAASFCSSLKSLRNISPFLSRVQAT